MNKVATPSESPSYLLLKEVTIKRHLLSRLIKSLELYGFDPYTTRTHAEKTIPGYEIEPGLSRRSYRVLEKEHLGYSTPSAIAVNHFGESTPWQCVEIIEASAHAARSLGVTSSQTVIRINNRDLLAAILHESIGTTPVQTELLIKLFSARKSMEAQAFADKIIEVLGSNAQTQINKLVQVVSLSDLPDENVPAATKSGVVYEFTDTVIEELKALNIGKVVFDPTLVNASTYAAGLVFSVDVVKNGSSVTLASGGYESAPSNAIDLSLGEYISLDSVIAGMELVGIELPSQSHVELLVTFTDVMLEPNAQQLARTLREDGVKVQVQYVGQNKERAHQVAKNELIPFSLILDDDTRSDDVYLFIETKTGSGQELGGARIVSIVKDYRQSFMQISEEDRLFEEVLTV